MDQVTARRRKLPPGIARSLRAILSIRLRVWIMAWVVAAAVVFTIEFFDAVRRSPWAGSSIVFIRAVAIGALLISSVMAFAAISEVLYVGSLRRKRRCATCDYLLTGLRSNMCPECGNPFEQPAR